MAVEFPGSGRRSSGVRTVVERSPGPHPGGRSVQYYVGPDDALERWTASDILDAVDDGRLDLDTPVRVSPARAAVPLRRHLRDLVFVAHRQSRSRAGDDVDADEPFRRAFAGAPVPCALSDLSGRLIEVNDAFCTLVGRDASTLVGALVGDLSHAEDRAAEIRLGNELFAGTRGQFSVDKRFLHASGESIPCRVHIGLVRDPDGHPREVVATVIDLRGQLELETLRARAVEVAAVQAIARRIAHDFGNALFVIGSSRELLCESGAVPVAEQEHLAAIGQATDLCARMVEQLRELSGASAAAITTLDLAAAVAGRAELLRGLLGRDVGAVFDVPTVPTPARVDPAALDRILLNLVSNAAQHTPPWGTVTVSVAATPWGPRLRVRDTGVGMSEAVRQRALEPFFTARAGGTGLGLAIVNAAATSMGAALVIRSTPGAGTTVEVRFQPGAT